MPGVNHAQTPAATDFFNSLLMPDNEEAQRFDALLEAMSPNHR